MRQTILGRKLGMTQIFDRQGNAIPVTIVQAGPCTVLQVKTVETDGYNAIQLGFGDKKEKHTTKPLLGHFQKADATPKRHIREARVDDPSMFTVGQVITAGLFEIDDHVDVTGLSKGKGFAGVMKRHGFAGFMATHGVHESKRGPGSIGQSADPAKVFKGMRMPGQMGNETVTIQNLRVVDVRESQNLIMVKGPIPGGKNGLLVINHAIKKDAPPLRQKEPEEVEEAPVDEEMVETPETDEASAPDDMSADLSADLSAEADEAKEEAEEAKKEETTVPDTPEAAEVSDEAEEAPEAEAIPDADDAAETAAETPEPEAGADAAPEPEPESPPASEDSEDDSKKS